MICKNCGNEGNFIENQVKIDGEWGIEFICPNCGKGL
jgi:predicted RNA-binding Zn-ribbon protein involved in translation (DUF1610 family)